MAVFFSWNTNTSPIARINFPWLRRTTPYISIVMRRFLMEILLQGENNPWNLIMESNLNARRQKGQGDLQEYRLILKCLETTYIVLDEIGGKLI